MIIEEMTASWDRMHDTPIATLTAHERYCDYKLMEIGMHDAPIMLIEQIKLLASPSSNNSLLYRLLLGSDATDACLRQDYSETDYIL